MRRAGSILLWPKADATAVPAGHCPCRRPRRILETRRRPRIAAEPRVSPSTARKKSRHSTRDDPQFPDQATITILASGPLTSPALAAELQRLTGSDHLAFYDSISPIVDASTIDMNKVYFAARYDKGTADYINCPFTKEEYERFLDALTTAEAVPAKNGSKSQPTTDN